MYGRLKSKDNLGTRNLSPILSVATTSLADEVESCNIHLLQCGIFTEEDVSCLVRISG